LSVNGKQVNGVLTGEKIIVCIMCWKPSFSSLWLIADRRRRKN